MKTTLAILVFLANLAHGAEGICNRHPVLQYEVLRQLKWKVNGGDGTDVPCDKATPERLARITELQVIYYVPNEPRPLVSKDLEGLVNVKHFRFDHGGAPFTLRSGFFKSMPNLKTLRIGGNMTDELTLDGPVFSGISQLEQLEIHSAVSKFDSKIFSGLGQLSHLMINIAKPVPHNLFANNGTLRSLMIFRLGEETGTTYLPTPLLFGLADLKELTLGGFVKEFRPIQISKQKKLARFNLNGVGNVTLNKEMTLHGHFRSRTMPCDEIEKEARGRLLASILSTRKTCGLTAGTFETGAEVVTQDCEEDEEGGFHTAIELPAMCRR